VRDEADAAGVVLVSDAVQTRAALVALVVLR
jgi:hypothetical protein